MRTNFMTFFSLNHSLKTTNKVTLSAGTDIRPSLWLEWVPRNLHINLNFLIGIVGSGARWKAFGFEVRTSGKGCPVSMIVGSCSHGTRSFTFRSGFCEARGSQDLSSTRACLLFHTFLPAEENTSGLEGSSAGCRRTQRCKTERMGTRDTDSEEPLPRGSVLFCFVCL